MSAPIIAFFNNKGGVGKTSIAYHLSWMYSEMGRRTIAVDLDPQANLSSAFLDEDTLEQSWDSGDAGADTVYKAVKPLIAGSGDIASMRAKSITEHLALLTGDLNLSIFEDELADAWTKCLGSNNERALKVMSAFWRIIQNSAQSHKAEIVLMDLGPNLGATNRAALIAADYVLIPLSADLFSLQGLKNLGPRFREWREEWKKRLNEARTEMNLPKGSMKPIGYTVNQYGVRLDRPVKSYQKWMERIPGTYRTAVLGMDKDPKVAVADDPHCLAQLKHYFGLVPMAQEARKPIFLLRPADGAIGAHLQAAQSAYHDFHALAERIEARVESESSSASTKPEKSRST